MELDSFESGDRYLSEALSALNHILREPLYMDRQDNKFREESSASSAQFSWQYLGRGRVTMTYGTTTYQESCIFSFNLFSPAPPPSQLAPGLPADSRPSKLAP